MNKCINHFKFKALLTSEASAKPDFEMQGFATVGTSTTGSNNKNIVTADTLEELTKALSSEEPTTVHISKKISGGTTGASLRVKSDKTIIGVGSDAFLEGVGLHLSKVSNVIIRNIKFTMSSVDKEHHKINDGDCITIENAKHVWIDHNEFFAIDPHVQKDKDLFDGLVDIKDESEYITVSWNYFHDHWKCNLVGHSDTDNFDRKITFSHNHWKNINSRTPSYRFGTGHIYNNYFESLLETGIHSRMGACLLIEKNYFENCSSPLTNDAKTPGKWHLNDNYFHDIKGVTPTDSTCDLSVPYKYVLEDKMSVKETVLQYAGVGKI